MKKQEDCMKEVVGLITVGVISFTMGVWIGRAARMAYLLRLRRACYFNMPPTHFNSFRFLTFPPPIP